MPTITAAEVVGFAHCRNPRCPGSQQEQVKAIQHIESYSYLERGGDLPGEEMSTVRLTFADEAEMPCPNCALTREVTAEPRPSYQGEWGEQNFLLDIEVGADGSRFDPSKQAELQSQASEKLQEENAELRERLAKLEGFMLGQQSVEEPEAE